MSLLRNFPPADTLVLLGCEAPTVFAVQGVAVQGVPLPAIAIFLNKVFLTVFDKCQNTSSLTSLIWTKNVNINPRGTSIRQ